MKVRDVMLCGSQVWKSSGKLSMFRKENDSCSSLGACFTISQSVSSKGHKSVVGCGRMSRSDGFDELPARRRDLRAESCSSDSHA